MKILNKLVWSYRNWQAKRLKIKLAKWVCQSQVQPDEGFSLSNEVEYLYRFITTSPEQEHNIQMENIQIENTNRK